MKRIHFAWSSLDKPEEESLLTALIYDLITYNTLETGSRTLLQWFLESLQWISGPYKLYVDHGRRVY